MPEDLTAEITVTITREEARRVISSLQMLFASLTAQTESENFEDAVDALKEEAKKTQDLVAKIKKARE